MKTVVQSAVRPLAGVYLIVNLVTGDMYVGSGITNRIGNRFHKHLFGGTGSKPVAAAVTQYGLDNFAFIVLDTLSDTITDEDNTALLYLEGSFLQSLSPAYNVAPKAGNTFGVKHTAETKALMSANYSSERREAIGALNRG